MPRRMQLFQMKEVNMRVWFRVLPRKSMLIFPKVFCLKTLNHALKHNSKDENELELPYTMY